MGLADTPRKHTTAGDMPTVCPMCGAIYRDGALTHCPTDDTLLAPYEVGSAVERTRVDRIVGGRYRLEEKLGEGGMGRVYAAVHGLSGRRVALKVIRPELESSSVARERFLRECRVLERVSSPHVVQVIESGASAAGEIYLVMELLEGESLRARLDSGALRVDEAIAISLQICAALRDAHAENIVHRDLKPDNVILGPDGRARVLDFGIARLLDGQTLDGGSHKLTATGAIVGTPAYISPEAAAGNDIDHRTDLYSLGVMLFEMIRGDVPFWDERPVVLMGKHIQEPPPSLRGSPGIPDALALLVERLLAKDPSERPQRAEEVRQALDAVAAGEASGTRPITTAKAPRSRLLLYAAALLGPAALVLIALGVVWALASEPATTAITDDEPTPSTPAAHPLRVEPDRETAAPDTPDVEPQATREPELAPGETEPDVREERSRRPRRRDRPPRRPRDIQRSY